MYIQASDIPPFHFGSSNNSANSIQDKWQTTHCWNKILVFLKLPQAHRCWMHCLPLHLHVCNWKGELGKLCREKIWAIVPTKPNVTTSNLTASYYNTRGTQHAASLAQSRAWRLQTCSAGMICRNEIVKRSSKCKCYCTCTAAVGPHGTPVHDFLSVA